MNKQISLTNRLRRADLLHWNSLWLALYLVGIGIFFIVMPKYFDDQQFSFLYGEWYRQQGILDITGGGNLLKYGIPWDAIKERWYYLITRDNGRLVNIIDSPMVLLPKWIGSSICLIAWAITIFGMFRLVRIDFRRSALVALSIFLAFFCFPWEDSMGCFIFQINYTVPSAVAIYLLLLLREPKSGKRHVATLAIWGLLLGCMHEGFSMPLLASLIINLLIFPKTRNANTYAACTGLALGTVWLIAVPAFQTRVGGLDYGFLESLFATLKRFAKITLMNPGFWAMLIVTAVIGIKKCLRLFVSDPLCAIFYIGIPLSLLLATATNGTPRAAWWCDLMAFCLVPYLLNRAYPEFWSRYKRRNYAIAVLCLTSALGLTSVAAAMTFKTIGEYKELLLSLQKNPDAPVLNEWIGCSDDILRKLAKFDLLMMAYHPIVIGTLPPTADGKPRSHATTKCIPERIADFEPSKAQRIYPGNTYIYKNELIIDTTDNLPSRVYADINFGGVRKEKVVAYTTAFKSKSDGRTYYHVRVGDYFWLRMFLGISGAKV